MLQVNHQITIGNAVYQSGDRTRLVSLRSAAALDVPVNTCRIVLSPPEGLSLAADDPVTVELGYGNELTQIFTGRIGSVEWGIEQVEIHAAGAFQRLLLARFNLLFEKSKAGDICSDMIGRLNLPSGTVESGPQFPVYAFGDNRPVYDHLAALARQCGFDFYADTADRVVFAPYRSQQTHEFQYGVNILALTSEEPTSPITGVEVYGESPSSFGQGSEAYSWLTKQDVQGSAGSTTGVVKRVADPTARTLETAAQLATALLNVETQQRQGTLRVLGTPAVRLGDAVNVSKLPNSAQNGTFKPTGISHVLNGQQGFYTVIQWKEA